MYIDYKIVAGDTLSALAVKFGTTVEEIKKANSKTIKNINSIYTGQHIIIPVSEGSDELKRVFRSTLSDIQTLPNFKKLMALLGE